MMFVCALLFFGSFMLAGRVATQVTLNPGNITTLACVSGSVQFSCIAPVSAVWITTGFMGDGINQMSAVPGLTVATSSRVETMDMNPTVATSVITVHNFSLGDQNAVVMCINGLNSTERTQTRIVIGPPDCDVSLMFQLTSTSITVMWEVSQCLGAYPVMFEVQWISTVSTNDNGTSGPLSGGTGYLIPELRIATTYNISLILSDGCGNGSILHETATTSSEAPSPSPPFNSSSSNFTGGPDIIVIIVPSVVVPIVVIASVVVAVTVTIVVLKQKQKLKPDGERLTRQPGEELAALRDDTTYASPGKEKSATEGADGVYSYAATTTVVGAKMEPMQKAGKMPNDEKYDTQPDKPKRGKYKQPPTPADVSHKQGPAGELYAMPDKKAPTVGHVQGPHGDMYAVSAKPSKGTYGAEGPQ